MKIFNIWNLLFLILTLSSQGFSAPSYYNIDESESDKFIKRVKDLSTIDVKDVKDKDIILLVGPTGAGKSTVLNIIAGSKITCKKNEETDEWEVYADPSVATIGHKGSETFIPNYWQDSLGNRFYDCPGFNDTRGIDYDVAKSYFLKTIGDCAQSLKVILVGDINTLGAERGETFTRIVKQINSFIPTFDLTTDSEFIVTKAPSSKKPSHISNLLKNKIGWCYADSQITILHEPNEESGSFPHIDLRAIINRSPSIKKKCDFPLSSEAKLKIGNLKDEFNQEIKQVISVLSERINFCYLDLIQNNLEVSQDLLDTWYRTFKEVESTIKGLLVVEELQEGLNSSINKLKNLNGTLYTEDISLFLKRKIENLNFLEKISGESSNLASYWGSSFHFNLPSFSKGKNLAKFKNLEDLNKFLKGKNLNPEKDIKSQIHNILNNSDRPYEFYADYSGSKNHSGTIDYSGKAAYSGKEPYWGNVNYEGEVPYSGSAHYSGSKSFSGIVSTPKCTHNKGFFNVDCWICDHYEIDIPYVKSVDYSGYVPYSGSIKYSGKENYSGSVDYSGAVPYSGTVSYNVTVPYTGSHKVICQEHHSCSCKDLALMVLSAKEVHENIKYYSNIITLQRPYLKEIQEDKESLGDISNLSSFFSLKGKNLLENKIELDDLIYRIHQTLSKSHTFEVSYSDKVNYLVQKAYSGEVSYSGNAPYSGSVNYQGSVPYSGSVYYSGSKNYSGTVKAKSCYDPCSWCEGNVVNLNRACSGSIDYSGYAPYSGSVKYSGEKGYSGNLSYSGNKSYSGEVDHLVSIPYSGEHKVTCQEDHHDCDSCTTWDAFVLDLTILLKGKEKYINVIKKHKESLALKKD